MMQEPPRPLARENLGKTVILALAFLLLALFGGRLIISAARIFFGACLISFLIVPIAALFEKKLPRAPSCVIALSLILLVILLSLGLLLPVLARQISGIAELLPSAFERIQRISDGISAWMQRRLPGLQLSQPDFGFLQDNLSGFALQTISYAGSIAGSLYQLVLMVILAYFLMAEREKALLRAELLIPGPWRKTAVRMGNSLLRELRLYLRGQATIALAVGILASIALSIIGVKAAPLLGLIVGVFNVIPYFGPFIGGIPAVIMALSLSWQKAAFTSLALLLVQQVDSFVLSPRIMGGITGFSPAVILLAIFLGQQCAGVWGMLFAMPLMMSFRTVYRVFVQRHENN